MFIVCLCIAILYMVVRHRASTEKMQDTASSRSASVSSMDDTCVPNIAETVTPAETLPVDVVKNDSHDDDNADDEDDQFVTHNEQLIVALHHAFEEEKVFLQPDIHIDDVARMLVTNRTYITRLMRQEYGLSFMEYVNVARVQYSQQLLYSYDLTLDEVAEKSGFLSASNYCRVFRRIVGSSPTVWIQKVKRK